MDGELALLVAACLIVPPVWGWALHRVFARLGLRRWLPGAAVPAREAEELEEVWTYQI